MGLRHAIVALLLAGCAREPFTVDVCVLNAASLPESELRIDEAMAYSSSKLEEFARISLNVVEQARYEGDLNRLVFENGAFLNPHKACAKPHDVAMLFTSANNVLSVAEGENRGNPVRGSLYRDRGYGVIFGLRPGQPESQHKWATAHEWGHYFWLNHVRDPNDVMHKYAKEREPSFTSFKTLRRYGRDALVDTGWRSLPGYIVPEEQ